MTYTTLAAVRCGVGPGRGVLVVGLCVRKAPIPEQAKVVRATLRRVSAASGVHLFFDLIASYYIITQRNMQERFRNSPLGNSLFLYTIAMADYDIAAIRSLM